MFVAVADLTRGFTSEDTHWLSCLCWYKITACTLCSVCDIFVSGAVIW